MLAPPWGVRLLLGVGWRVVTNVGPTLGSDSHVRCVVDVGVGQVRSRVELFEDIRRDQRREDLSIRELASRHGVHRRTVRQALTAAVPPPRAVYPSRSCPAMGQWWALVDGWLVGDQDVPRKQRHTARRVWQRLVAEHQACVSEVTVSRHVRRRRVELGIVDREVFDPQVHEPGAEAEVDFGELQVNLGGGQLVKC